MRKLTTVRWGRFAAIALLLCAVVGIAVQETAPVAQAHAALIRSSPENGAEERRPPARVILYFSEPVEPKLTEITVFDVDQNEVDEGDVAVDDKDATVASVGVPTLAPGLYTVEFSNVSTVDGHPWNGIYQFIVLNPDGTVPENAVFDPNADAGGGSTGLLPKNTDSALKWIALLALAITAGSALFVLVVVRPAASFLEDDDYRAATDAGDSWLVGLAHVLLPVSFIAAALLVVISVGRFGTTTTLFEYLTTVRTGRYQLANLCLVALALVGADVVYLSGRPAWRRVGMMLLLGASLGAMVTYSMTSHGATGEGKFWSISSDFLHFAASSAWLGALALLVPLWRFAQKRLLDEPVRFLYLANAFDRFSLLAGLSVITVMTTGVFNGLVEIPSWSAFTDTTYGKVLFAKLIIVGLLLPVAGLNALILKPRLVAAIDGLYQGGGPSSKQERTTWEKRLEQLQRVFPVVIIIEVALVVAVFASVAVLTQTSTAKGEIAQKQAAQAAKTEFTDVQDAADLNLTLEIQPNRVGINRYSLTIRHAADGSPLTTATQVRLRFRYTDPTQPDVVGPVAELLLRASTNPGEYEGQGAYFTQPGTWQAEAGIRRSDGDDVSRTFVVSARPSEATAKDSGSAYSLPFDTFFWNEVVGALLAVLGLMAIIYREQFRTLTQHSYRIGVTTGTAMILVGAVLWFGVDRHQRVGNPSAGNPVAATEASIAAGRMLFQQNCIVCHGTEGRGDGPQAASLNPRPADIRQHLPLHIDAQFFAFITNGVGGTAMPAWREAFSDEEIWNLVNYLRTFENVATE
jgi:copper transport protein